MGNHRVIDIHSHILFGIDDGADTIAESLEMLKMAEKQGVKTVFCTSHHWQAESSDYDLNFELLKEKVTSEGIDVKLHKGMEILCEDDRYFPETLRDINNGTVKTLNGCVEW